MYVQETVGGEGGGGEEESETAESEGEGEGKDDAAEGVDGAEEEVESPEPLELPPAEDIPTEAEGERCRCGDY